LVAKRLARCGATVGATRNSVAKRRSVDAGSGASRRAAPSGTASLHTRYGISLASGPTDIEAKEVRAADWQAARLLGFGPNRILYPLRIVARVFSIFAVAALFFALVLVGLLIHSAIIEA